MILGSFLEWMNSLSTLESVIFGMTIGAMIVLVYRFGYYNGRLNFL